MVAGPALAAVQNYLRALQTNGLPVRFGVVFGSQAKGQANQWSDIDLLVVSPQFDGPSICYGGWPRAQTAGSSQSHAGNASG